MLQNLLMIILIPIALICVVATGPVEAVLFLITAFVLSAIILFIHGSTILGFVYIIVYVGAVAILFLFVLMLLDIKGHAEGMKVIVDALLSVAFGFMLSMIYLFITTPIAQAMTVTEWHDAFSKVINELQSGEALTIIVNYGQSIFNYYPVYVVIAGIVLLVALIGAILLTHNYVNTNPNLKRFVIR